MVNIYLDDDDGYEDDDEQQPFYIAWCVQEKKYYLFYILLFSDNLIKDENWYLAVLKNLSLNLEHLLDSFFRVLVEAGVTIGFFPKTFVDDVDIVFVLPVTICIGVCEQAEP